MIYSQNRDEIRQVFVQAWHKHRNKLPIEPMEKIIAAIIQQHPEYHAVLEDADMAMHSEYTPEQGQSNPFLHMGMHITLHEQVSTNRPDGIGVIYQTLREKFSNNHTAEHQMMECLGEALWEAQRNGSTPDEQLYLERLKRLV